MHPISFAVARLSDQLPLADRQALLAPDHREAHRAILDGFAARGRPPHGLPPAVLETLEQEDLIVTGEGGAVVGAYPFTLEQTPHRVIVGGNELHAMCSLDAVAIAPVFGTDVVIESTCAVSGTSIAIEQRGDEVIAASPADLRVGIRWQEPEGCAAHSMCREMVFLAGPDEAAAWSAVGDSSVFPLPEAIDFGTRFFRPLMG